MRSAIPTEGKMVSPHFGRAPSFTIIDIENGKVLNRKEIESPGHQPGAIPEFLRQQGVECVICEGMGIKAISLFKEHGIKVITGVSGNIDEVIEKLIKGKLSGGEDPCKHNGEGGCDHSHN